MNSSNTRRVSRSRRHKSIRQKISGTPERPRIAVFRTSKHIYAQAIDDVNRVTLKSMSTLEKDFKDACQDYSGNKNSAKVVGKLLGEKLASMSIQSAVFDRGGYLYHGRVQNLADGIREAGIKV